LPLDADHDGKISKDEVLKQFSKLDADGDGSITREEIAKHFQSLHSQHGAADGNAGGNARPSTGGPVGNRFPQARRGGRPTPELLLQRFDHNHDGKLSKDELPEFLWSRLSTADTDKDGSVSKSELEEFSKQHQPAGPSGRPANPQKPVEKPAAPAEKPKEEGKAT
jgi:Ca2+-binding EF-hand superfamily protein